MNVAFDMPRMSHEDATITLMNVGINAMKRIPGGATWDDFKIICLQLLQDAERQGWELGSSNTIQLSDRTQENTDG